VIDANQEGERLTTDEGVAPGDVGCLEVRRDVHVPILTGAGRPGRGRRRSAGGSHFGAAHPTRWAEPVVARAP
jgi:hypothetical protein